MSSARVLALFLAALALTVRTLFVSLYLFQFLFLVLFLSFPCPILSLFLSLIQVFILFPIGAWSFLLLPVIVLLTTPSSLPRSRESRCYEVPRWHMRGGFIGRSRQNWQTCEVGTSEGSTMVGRAFSRRPWCPWCRTVAISDHEVKQTEHIYQSEAWKDCSLRAARAGQMTSTPFLVVELHESAWTPGCQERQRSIWWGKPMPMAQSLGLLLWINGDAFPPKALVFCGRFKCSMSMPHKMIQNMKHLAVFCIGCPQTWAMITLCCGIAAAFS